MYDIKKITLPTYVTLVRLLIAPVVIPVCIIHYIPMQDFFLSMMVMMLFLFFGFTDFLDGFFARKYDQVSKFGAALDHLADKILMLSAFIALLVIGKISYVWVIVLLSRDFLMMGLREIALEYAISMKVSSLGKLKTGIHILFITSLFMWSVPSEYVQLLSNIQIGLLTASVIVSVGSALHYCTIFYQSIR